MIDRYTFHITPQAAGERLDKFLTAHVPELTRTRLKALIEAEHVLLGQAPLPILPENTSEDTSEDLVEKEEEETEKDTPQSLEFRGDLEALSLAPCIQASKKLKPGFVVSLTVPAVAEALPVAQQVDFEVVFEDDHVIVINKPAGLVVHPGAGNPDQTLVNGLLYHCGDSLSGIGGVARPGIVHRLDKGTSGLMVVAKNDHAHHFLSNQFVDRTLKRTYFAICWGVPGPIEGKIEGNIGRDPRHRQRMKVLKYSGKEAITNYALHEKLGNYCSLIECNLETGRTHQIRVHMTYKGNGLLGDPLYGRKPRGLEPSMKEKISELTQGETRPALHAARLEFVHPVTKKLVAFETELPDDFEAMYEYLKTV